MVNHFGHFKDNYYWIAKSDSLFTLAYDLRSSDYPVLYQLFFSSEKTYLHEGKSYIYDLYPDNSDRFYDMSADNKNEKWYPLIKMITENRIKLQTIRTKYKPRRQHPEKRWKERVNVYCVPIWGCFEKVLYHSIDGKDYTVYHPLTMDYLKAWELDENEMKFLYKLECNTIDFGTLDNKFDFWHKGWCSLKVSPQ